MAVRSNSRQGGGLPYQRKNEFTRKSEKGLAREDTLRTGRASSIHSIEQVEPFFVVVVVTRNALIASYHAVTI